MRTGLIQVGKVKGVDMAQKIPYTDLQSWSTRRIDDSEIPSTMCHE